MKCCGVASFTVWECVSNSVMASPQILLQQHSVTSWGVPIIPGRRCCPSWKRIPSPLLSEDIIKASYWYWAANASKHAWRWLSYRHRQSSPTSKSGSIGSYCHVSWQWRSACRGNVRIIILSSNKARRLWYKYNKHLVLGFDTWYNHSEQHFFQIHVLGRLVKRSVLSGMWYQ